MPGTGREHGRLGGEHRRRGVLPETTQVQAEVGVANEEHVDAIDRGDALRLLHRPGRFDLRDAADPAVGLFIIRLEPVPVSGTGSPGSRISSNRCQFACLFLQHRTQPAEFVQAVGLGHGGYSSKVLSENNMYKPITLTTRYARVTETPSCLRQGYGDHGRKYKRHGFLKGYAEGEELIIPPLACPELCRRAPGIAPRNRCGIFNSGTPELQIPQHFFSSLCLCV